MALAVALGIARGYAPQTPARGASPTNAQRFPTCSGSGRFPKRHSVNDENARTDSA